MDKDLGKHNITVLLQTIVWDYNSLGNHKKCLEYSQHMVRLDPEYPNSKINYDYYKHLVENEEVKGKGLQTFFYRVITWSLIFIRIISIILRKNFRKLVRIRFPDSVFFWEYFTSRETFLNLK